MKIMILFEVTEREKVICSVAIHGPTLIPPPGPLYFFLGVKEVSANVLFLFFDVSNI